MTENPENNSATESSAESEPPRASNTATLVSDQLKGFFAEIERLEEEKAQIGAEIAEIFKAAKEKGFDTGAMKEILKRQKMSKEDREKLEAQVDLYEGVLGLTGEKDEAELMGIQAASEGAPATANPYTKRDPRRQKWDAAWQMQNMVMAATGETPANTPDKDQTPDAGSATPSPQEAATSTGSTESAATGADKAA